MPPQRPSILPLSHLVHHGFQSSLTKNHRKPSIRYHTLDPAMRIFAILLLVTLCLCPIGQAQPLPKAGHQSGESSQKAQNLVARGYKPITLIENKKFIGLLAGVGLTLTLGLGLFGLDLTEHQACKTVEKQQRILQERWDEMHPDGFTPAGDQMRPISFDCKTQERHLKPLVSYNNPAELYR